MRLNRYIDDMSRCALLGGDECTALAEARAECVRLRDARTERDEARESEQRVRAEADRMLAEAEADRDRLKAAVAVVEGVFRSALCRDEQCVFGKPEKPLTNSGCICGAIYRAAASEGE